MNESKQIVEDNSLIESSKPIKRTKNVRKINEIIFNIDNFSWCILLGQEKGTSRIYSGRFFDIICGNGRN